VSINREWLEKDYYAVLGVPKNASPAEIKKAYRKLAQKHHPDANSGDKRSEERFKDVSTAYDVLGNAERRAEYDRVREMAAGGVRFGPGGGGGGRVRFEDLGFDVGGFGDLFDLFGGAGRRTRSGPRRGADLEAEVRVTFEDAWAGTTVPLRVSGATPCAACGGSGARPGTLPRKCPECSGSGVVAVEQGPFSMAQTCTRCAGRGQIIEDPCATCGGKGAVVAERELRVKVPAGVEDGARIRLAGRGEAAPSGGNPGDLYVVVRVAPHRFFGRRGSDLLLTLPITYPEAALGAQVQVPTMNGTVTLKVPAGTTSGRTFRVRGKGAPKRRGGKGDLMVTVQVEVPTRLSREEKQLLKQLQEAGGQSPRGRLGVS
jgi:molecular chaperone DnaJ